MNIYLDAFLVKVWYMFGRFRVFFLASKFVVQNYVFKLGSHAACICVLVFSMLSNDAPREVVPSPGQNDIFPPGESPKVLPQNIRDRPKNPPLNGLSGILQRLRVAHSCRVRKKTTKWKFYTFPIVAVACCAANAVIFLLSFACRVAHRLPLGLC